MYIYYIILHYIYIYIYTLTKKLQEKKRGGGGNITGRTTLPQTKTETKTLHMEESGGSQGNQEFTTPHVWGHQGQRGQQRHPTLPSRGRGNRAHSAPRAAEPAGARIG